MNAPKQLEPAPPSAPAPARSYSPFPALFTVFLALIALQGLYLADDVRQHSRLEAAQADLAKTLSQAQAVQLTAERVGRELLALASANSAEAAKIVAEFQIKTNAPPQPMKPDSAPSHPSNQ